MNDDCSRIVASTERDGRVDQLIRDPLRLAARTDDPQDLPLIDDAMDPIGADDRMIALKEGDEGVVRLGHDDHARAQSTSDDIRRREGDLLPRGFSQIARLLNS